MIFTRINILAIGLTLLAIIFIEINAEPLGRIFWHLLTIHDLPAAWLMVATLVIGHWFCSRHHGDGAWVERLLLTLDHRRYEVAFALWLILCAASVVVYRNHPLSMDEYAVVFQAKVFAAGAMHGQFPPELLDMLIPRGFQNHFLMVNRTSGAVVSAYWPGFSLLLTPFMALGIPWACNPTLAVTSFLLIGRVARDVVASPLAAGWAMLFALASPAFVANGITYYSMSAHLLFNLGFAWLLLSPSPFRLLLAGLVGGFALALHNPFPHAVFAAPWILWLVIRSERRLVNLGWLGTGYLVLALPLVVGWSLWQRELLLPLATATPAVVAKIGEMVSLGVLERSLGVLRGFLRVLQWPDELIVYSRLGGLAKLWLWASPLLLLLAWQGGRGEKSVPLRLMGASALVTFFAYFLIRFDQGHGWGYRYFHPAWGVLPVLAALGTVKLAATEGSRAVRQICLVTLISLVAANTLRIVQMGDFIADHLAQFPPQVEGGRGLVMHNGRGYYGIDLIQNDPWLRGNEIVVLRMKQSDTDLLLQRFPGEYERHSNRFGETFVEKKAVASDR